MNPRSLTNTPQSLNSSITPKTSNCTNAPKILNSAKAPKLYKTPEMTMNTMYEIRTIWYHSANVSRLVLKWCNFIWFCKICLDLPETINWSNYLEIPKNLSKCQKFLMTKLSLKSRFIIKTGFKSRAGYDGACTVAWFYLLVTYVASISAYF